MKIPQIASIVAVVFAAGSFAGSHLAAQTAPTRVAVVDVQKVLTQSKAGKASYDKLKKQQDAAMAKAKQLDEELRKLDGEIASKRASLGEDKLSEMMKTLADKRIAMQRFAQDSEREIGESRDRELMALETKIKPVIDGVSKEMGLALVFNKFESGLIYAADAVDVTDGVIKKFNEAAP